MHIANPPEQKGLYRNQGVESSVSQKRATISFKVSLDLMSAYPTIISRFSWIGSARTLNDTGSVKGVHWYLLQKEVPTLLLSTIHRCLA